MVCFEPFDPSILVDHAGFSSYFGSFAGRVFHLIQSIPHATHAEVEAATGVDALSASNHSGVGGLIT